MTGADLRAVRDRLGLTQARLAELVEPPLDRHKVSHLEARGAERLPHGMAARLREAIRRLERE